MLVERQALAATPSAAALTGAALSGALSAGAPTARAALVVEPFQAGDEEAWDAYVEGRADATLYHLRAWKDVVEQAYGMEAPYLLARLGMRGPVRGILPLVRVGRPFAPYITSGPFGSYGPLLVDDERAGRALLAAACRFVDENRAKYLHLKINGVPPSWVGLVQRTPAVVSRLELAASPDVAFRGLNHALRNEIRHAERAGFTREIGGEVEAFYDVLGENMHRKGAPMYGRPFFRLLMEKLGARCAILTLRLEGKVVAAAFLAWFQGVMYMPFASARPSVFHLRANYLLWWEIIRVCIERGLKTLDFGISPEGSAGLVFKRKWGPRFEPVTAVLYSRDGSIPALATADSRVAQAFLRAWRRLPRWLVEAAGPTVCSWVA